MRVQGLATQLEADDTEIGALRDEVQDMLRDTEVALATFGRSKLRHDNPEYAMLPSVMPDAYLQVCPPLPATWREPQERTHQGKQERRPIRCVHVRSAYAASASGPLPHNVFMLVGLSVVVVGGLGSQRTAARLQATAVQYQKVVEDLEQVLTVAGQSPSAVNAHALPGILANQHQYLLHIAAKVEAMHVRVADAKHAALHMRRAAGDQRDPFHEAAVRQQAALRAAQVPSLRAC